ncbi:MAG: tetratricopeptide repeat protein [Phycisphaerales bacterium]|jgi:tetratricopeptide (TPR) repeat protein
MTNRALAVAILSCLVCAFGCATDRTEEFKRDLGGIVPDDTAQKQEAVRLVNQAYEVYHDNDRKQERRVAEAAALLERAIGLDPGFATAHLNLGVLHLENENLPMSVRFFRQAHLLMPGDSRPSYHLGVAYYRMGHAREAIDAYVRAIDIDESDIRAVRGLALACRSIHYADDTTLEVLQRSEMLEPDQEWRELMAREIDRQQRKLEMSSTG